MSGATEDSAWTVRKIGVVGAGVVGLPMAALLAQARIQIGAGRPAPVVLVQRNSATSGWKVAAVNAGRSPLGGVEPDLERIITRTVGARLLRASHDYASLGDADAILICVQTDKAGLAPEYGPLFEAIGETARAIKTRRGRRSQPPLVVIESTLAPSSMATVVRERFRRLGLNEGRDLRLAHSPNRVMPGHLVERVVSSDKLVGGLSEGTAGLVCRLYGKTVRQGRLRATNCLTAEVVKTMENAYRDARIAFSVEVARYCDSRDIDFYQVRDAVNRRLAWDDAVSADPRAVPSAGILVPTVGVGGHCLPKDGILLLWRRLEAGWDPGRSLILKARSVNEASPLAAARALRRLAGRLEGKRVALLGAAYRADSADARNSPTLALGKILAERGARLRLHDPYLKENDPNLIRSGLADCFTGELTEVLQEAEILTFCTGHQYYRDNLRLIAAAVQRRQAAVYDGCHLLKRSDLAGLGTKFGGVGSGRRAPSPAFLDFVQECFRAVETGFANELADVIDFLNGRYARRDFDRLDFQEIGRLAGTCVTGCRLPDPGPVAAVAAYEGFLPQLVRCAKRQTRP
jgi:UDP-N-acetyl-D-mannosaminuronic acid dehydrogenase